VVPVPIADGALITGGMLIVDKAIRRWATYSHEINTKSFQAPGMFVKLHGKPYFGIF
jgi:hypothetical protein